MKLTRRQGLLALGAGLGAVLLKASPLARLRSIPGFGPGGVTMWTATPAGSRPSWCSPTRIR